MKNEKKTKQILFLRVSKVFEAIFFLIVVACFLNSDIIAKVGLALFYIGIFGVIAFRPED